MTEVPIACTLGAPALARQGERWRALRARAGVTRRETASGLQLDFESAEGVEDELQALVAIENECCAWADWSVVRTEAGLRVELETAGDGVAAAHAMFR